MRYKDEIYMQTLSKLKTKLTMGAAADGCCSRWVLPPSHHLCFTNCFLQREQLTPGR